ncbi:hypothetical protein ACFFQF_00940 [Haladaptatus pallidirubidus]|uniref:Uncharacterized protein n=1 Tax=Haladaptatus pallidirubidus TaxID=1008152 RepID=A0AAV3UCY3_9EURY|nr:hypothetical protein [Haladaptatus pallidirubidus]
MVQHWAKLTVGGQVFEMSKGIVIEDGVRTGFLVGGDGGGSTVNAMFHELMDDGNPFNNSTGDGQRAGIHIDKGGGVFQVQIEFQTYQGNTDAFGGAGGGDVWSQAGELSKAIEQTEVDSFHPARLEYGTRTGGGALDVVFEQPMTTLDVNKFGIAEGSLTCLKTADLRNALDAIKRLPF